MSFFQTTLEFHESLTTFPVTHKKRFQSSIQVSEINVKVRVQDAHSSSSREDRDRKALTAPREADLLSEHMHCWAGPQLLCSLSPGSCCSLSGAAPLCHALVAPPCQRHMQHPAASQARRDLGDRFGKLRAGRSCLPSDLSSS